MLTPLTGDQLHALLLRKWGRSFDLQFRRVGHRIFLQVMWRYLEQASYPDTPEDYAAHLGAIAQHLNDWGCAQQVCTYIETTREKPRLGKAVNIPLDLGTRIIEWLE
ncbi:MAG: hypothetical protein KatS3mg067_1778 [Thermosynechococcus sp.]|uniref:DUF3067 family protein n=1 Tax=Thermosynechococcus sp. TaxID=2814275 RepID=UPI0022094921|nr:DUF3067 family protein [Thermosynechococcus sp.]BCX12840.1 MAG: hypothetical protein KatS3mg067_1778 [Thermosynechococcus sp.]